MKWLACAITLVMLAASMAVAQSPSDQYLITPGVSIGPLKLGMLISEAAKTLGTPQPASTKLISIVLAIPEGSTHFWWPPATIQPNVTGDNGFGVVVAKDGTIFEIKSPFDKRYYTAQGPHIGSRVQDLLTAFGPPSRQATSGDELFYVYDSAGIAFLFENNRKYTNYGLVNGIWVFTPQGN